MVYIKAYCKNCKCVQKCKFIGIQEDREGKPLFKLVNCPECHTTITIPLKKK